MGTKKTLEGLVELPEASMDIQKQGSRFKKSDGPRTALKRDGRAEKIGEEIGTSGQRSHAGKNERQGKRYKPPSPATKKNVKVDQAVFEGWEKCEERETAGRCTHNGD